MSKQTIYGISVDSRHRLDRFDDAITVPNENWHHQVRGVDPVLADHLSDRAGAAEPPQSGIHAGALFKHLSSQLPEFPHQGLKCIDARRDDPLESADLRGSSGDGSYAE